MRHIFHMLLLGYGLGISAQEKSVPQLAITGNFQIDAASYSKDTAIGADPGSQLVRYNSFGNINVNYGNFSTGVRFESYQPPLLGYLPGYTGTGIPYKYARYHHKDIDITVGNFYDQFGSGMCFRSFEDRGLLYDNAMMGMRAIYTPRNGITIKGIIGRQRTYFDLSPGVVKGVDGEVNFTELINTERASGRRIFSRQMNSNAGASPPLAPLKTQVIIGGSFVSKYQAANDPVLNLPANVGCGAARINIIRGGFNFYTEGVYKINDPSYQNNFSFKDGKGFYASASLALDNGLTFMATAKMIDNMSFRSDRNATNTIDMINYSPPIVKNHTYMMMAYIPYASQLNGEQGVSGEIQYKFKKGTMLGGQYGTEISLNGSIMYGLDTTGIPASQNSVRQFNYSVNYFSIKSKNQFFHDYNIEINKKINKHFKFTLMYSMQYINQAQVQYNTADKAIHPDVYSNILVSDITWKYKPGKAIRFENQAFLTKDTVNAFGIGSWATGLVEWTPSSNWFVIAADQYNYGNPGASGRVHYYYGSIVHISGPTRITLSYGRQRQGIFCAGGVCRFVPSANAFMISISSSF